MATTTNAFDKAGKFFGAAYNEMERASNAQEGIQGAGEVDAQYGADTDSEYLYGAVQPKTGEFGAYRSPTADVDQVKEDLLTRARESRPSNGSLVLRAGGGANFAVKQ